MLEIINKPVDAPVEEDKRSPRLDPWHPFIDRIHGRIYDDQRFPDGMWVYTSAVISQGAGWVRTRNTFYVLGEKTTHCDVWGCHWKE